MIDSMTDHEGGVVRSTAITTVPRKWQPAMELLTPANLAQRIDRCGLRPTRQDGAGPDEFPVVGHGNQQVIEIAIDAKTFLPLLALLFLVPMFIQLFMPLPGPQ